MSATTTRLPHARAVSLAWELIALLSPYCERIEVLGSIRRGRPSVGDIELLAVPKILPSMLHDMFGDAVSHVPAIDMLDSALQDLLSEGTLQQRQPRKWGPKYKAALYQGFPLDLFIVTQPAQWGVLQLIRTGSADFTHRLVTPDDRHAFSPDGRDLGQGWMPPFMFCKKGSLWRINGNATAEQVQTPEELHVFAAIGRASVDPDQREV